MGGATANGMAAAAAPLRRMSASQQIHEKLRERIVSLELAPGQSLSRAEIAEHYGVSRERIRQIEVRAFEKQQKAMRSMASDQGLMN